VAERAGEARRSVRGGAGNGKDRAEGSERAETVGWHGKAREERGSNRYARGIEKIGAQGNGKSEKTGGDKRVSCSKKKSFNANHKNPAFALRIEEAKGPNPRRKGGAVATLYPEKAKAN